MNKYLCALWDLKLRVDAYNEHDEKADEAFNILKDFINLNTEGQLSNSIDSDVLAAIEFIKKHVEVQEHPDIFFYQEQPERILIDLRYLVDSDSLITKPENITGNNKGYNLVKRVLGLPEYKEK